MKQLSVITENKIGALAEICDVLARLDINIQTISGEGLGETGVVRLVTDDNRSAQAALEKIGYRVLPTEILVLRLRDRPGELARVAKRLANARVNVEHIYLLDKSERGVGIALKVDKMKEAQRLLKQ
jgi:hypothetical protein